MQKTRKELKRERVIRIKAKHRATKKAKSIVNVLCVKDYLIAGIYFLYRGGTIVYVGKSDDNVMQRICDHYKDGVKDFDSFSFESHNVSPRQLDAIETRFILKYKPEYNIAKNRPRPSMFI